MVSQSHFLQEDMHSLVERHLLEQTWLGQTRDKRINALKHQLHVNHYEL